MSTFSLAASLAIQTAELIKAAPQLELIREPDVGLVLFRRLGWKREDYDAWAQRLHENQVAFIPPTKWEGETVARFAFPHPSLKLVREVLARRRATLTSRIVPRKPLGSMHLVTLSSGYPRAGHDPCLVIRSPR